MKLKGTLEDNNVILITPLIDIMFLILIFFVLNSNFTKSKVIEVDVPQTISGDPQGVIESHVVLTIDHKIYINDVEVNLSSFSIELLNSTNNKLDPVIILEGDKGISYEFLMEIMDRIKVMGFNNISLLVKKM